MSGLLRSYVLKGESEDEARDFMYAPRDRVSKGFTVKNSNPMPRIPIINVATIAPSQKFPNHVKPYHVRTAPNMYSSP